MRKTSFCCRNEPRTTTPAPLLDRAGPAAGALSPRLPGDPISSHRRAQLLHAFADAYLDARAHHGQLYWPGRRIVPDGAVAYAAAGPRLHPDLRRIRLPARLLPGARRTSGGTDRPLLPRHAADGERGDPHLRV